MIIIDWTEWLTLENKDSFSSPIELQKIIITYLPFCNIDEPFHVKYQR